MTGPSIVGALLLLALISLSALSLELPNLSLFVKHGQQACASYLREKQEADYNHAHAKSVCTSNVAPSPSYTINQRRVLIGRGVRDFEKASDLLLDFQMINNMPWASLVRVDEGETKVGQVVGTLVNCYKVAWSLNPCRITCRGRSSHPTTPSTQIAFSTILGHLLEGEERFRVSMSPEIDGSEVFFEMFSYSRGNGLLGTIAFPLIRPLQRSFFRALESSFLQLMSSERKKKRDEEL